ncbi:hypothetical protein [Winogradskyella costae]|uniref:hypothetical protein n=1 Tax=Winogradskyella costae TaxID=2697008 RepID=UPI0015C76AB6|nr:hypothetical protein [Winogradskyella costae]
MIKQVFLHVLAALALSFLLYKLASFTLVTSLFVGIGTAILGLIYSVKSAKK